MEFLTATGLLLAGRNFDVSDRTVRGADTASSPTVGTPRDGLFVTDFIGARSKRACSLEDHAEDLCVHAETGILKTVGAKHDIHRSSPTPSFTRLRNCCGCSLIPILLWCCHGRTVSQTNGWCVGVFPSR